MTHLSGEVQIIPNPIGPVGGADLDARLLNLRQAVLHSKGYVDPRLLPRPGAGNRRRHVFTTGGLYLGLPKNWTIGLEGSFVTSLKHPYRGRA